MQKAINFLNKSEAWFFYGFLATFTLSIRKVLFFYPIRGQFNEYTGIYLYLSDIFLVLVLASAGVSILCNKILSKSRYKINFVAYLKQKIVIIPLLLVIFSFIGAFWSANWQIAIFKSIKLLEFYLLYLWVIFRFVPLMKCSTLVPWQQNVPRLPRSDKMFHVEHFICYWGGTPLRNIFDIIIISGVVQSFIAIWQFIAQKSVDLIWLKESIISPDIPGVAKIVLDGEKYIRAYGLFPHPNILGGFLILSMVLTFAFLKPFNFLRNLENGKIRQRMFHVEQKNSEECSTWNNFFATGMEHIIKQVWNNWICYVILGTQLVALFLTFSKSAWIGLIIALAYLWTRKIRYQKESLATVKKDLHACPVVRNCSTWNNFFATGMEHWKYFALLAGIVFLAIVIIKPDWHSIAGKSIEDRMFYFNVSPARFAVQSIAGGRGTDVLDLFLGTGIGQSVLYLTNLPNIRDWQFQPVHNVFLLILNELGIIGLFLFVWFIWKIIRNVPPQYKCSTPIQMFHPDTNVPPRYKCSTWNILRGRRGTFVKAIFYGFLFIMLFDHYFWDIQQGQIILWLVLGLIAGGKMWTSKETKPYPQDKAKQPYT